MSSEAAALASAIPISSIDCQSTCFSADSTALLVYSTFAVYVYSVPLGKLVDSIRCTGYGGCVQPSAGDSMRVAQTLSCTYQRPQLFIYEQQE
jgi:hypothetical protein